MSPTDEKQVNLWIGARWGLRSGALGGMVAGAILGGIAALLVLFTDFQLSGLEIFSVFWIAGVYGFVLGIVGGALGGLIMGAIAGATRIPHNPPLAGAGAGALFAVLLMVVFFLLYMQLNVGRVALAPLWNLWPVGLVLALAGAAAGFIAGRRFARYYERRPSVSSYDPRWND